MHKKKGTCSFFLPAYAYAYVVGVLTWFLANYAYALASENQPINERWKQKHWVTKFNFFSTNLFTT